VPLKIVYLAASALPSRGRANSIQVMMMCEAFVQNGHDVTLLAPDNPERMGDIDPYAYYGVLPTFRIEWLPWIPLKSRGYVYGWLAARRARQLRPDLVYGRSVPGCYCCTLLDLAAILELHDPINEKEWPLKNMFLRMLSRTQLRRVVVTSKSLARNLRDKYGLTPPLLRVAPNGAKAGALAGEGLVLDKGRLHAGYIGGLRPGKGMELIAKLTFLTPWAHYHIVGGNPLEIQHWKEQLRESANITFHGQVSPAETDRYRHSFDVLLAPYQRMAGNSRDEDLQTPWLSPLKIIEYMAAGKPILCSDLPPYREVLTHGSTALLCDPDQIDSWVEALQTLRENVHLRETLAKAALEEFGKHYTWQSRGRNVLEGI